MLSGVQIELFIRSSYLCLMGKLERKWTKPNQKFPIELSWTSGSLGALFKKFLNRKYFIFYIFLVKCGPHPCVVCKMTVESSRAVPKERAGQLGLKEEEVTENSRVCNNCWCKTLRSKCPLLSCSTAGKGKKLRHLPHKWKELSQATKDNLIAELRKFILFYFHS